MSAAEPQEPKPQVLWPHGGAGGKAARGPDRIPPNHKGMHRAMKGAAHAPGIPENWYSRDNTEQDC
jgi:hypothetical protein